MDNNRGEMEDFFDVVHEFGEEMGDIFYASYINIFSRQ